MQAPPCRGASARDHGAGDGWSASSGRLENLKGATCTDPGETARPVPLPPALLASTP